MTKHGGQSAFFSPSNTPPKEQNKKNLVSTDVFVFCKEISDGKHPIQGDTLQFSLDLAKMNEGKLYAKNVTGGSGDFVQNTIPMGGKGKDSSNPLLSASIWGSGGKGGGSGGDSNSSSSWGGNGTGDVDRKNIEDRDGWGKLPPAERTEALQQISRDLPTHYREAIEAYFRKLATDGS